MRYIPHILAALLLAASPIKAQETMPKMMYKTTETPAYQVEKSLGDAEIRLYAPRIAAEVTVKGDRSQAIRAGFRILAGYIFGGNTAQAKVAMTSPVSQTIAMTSPVAQTEQDGAWIVRFTMPSEYTLDSLPVPQDKTIHFVAQPADRQVVMRFSGLAGSAALAQKESDLRAWAVANGLDLGAGPFYYFYDDPLTLPWNRRNEVAFDLR